MAIRFVDKGPEDHPDRKAAPTRPKPSGQSSTLVEAPLAPTASEAAAPIAAPGEPGNAESSKLPHPKPVPRARGRKAAPSRAATPPVEPAQAPLEGLLPTLPHAKPEPKPRGRKKAFG